MKVKYNCQMYSVSLKDRLHVDCLKLILSIKRRYRRFRVLLKKEDVALYFIITMVWVVFGIVTYVVGQKQLSKQNYSILDVLWDLKNSYFTSVILAILINSYNQGMHYKNALKRQHYIYTDALNDFDNLFEYFVGQEMQNYMPLYCDKCLDDTITFIKSKYKEVAKALYVSSRINIDLIYERLSKIEDEIKNGNIIQVDEEMAICCINSAKRKIKRLLAKDDCQLSDFEEIALELYFVLEELRRPWRKDLKIRLKVLNLVGKLSSEAVTQDFYARMLVSGHSFH